MFHAAVIRQYGLVVKFNHQICRKITKKFFFKLASKAFLDRNFLNLTIVFLVAILEVLLELV